MINKLILHNFKCFDNIDIPLNRITLLAGENGSGKSSIIQALLLFVQSRDKEKISELRLFGNYIKLGYSHDIFYEFSEEKEPHIKIGICSGDDEYSIDVEYKSEMVKLSLDEPIIVGNEGLFGDNFEYIAAERISPEKIFSVFEDSDYIGSHGENAINYLNKFGSKPICDEICISDVENTLSIQTDYWMGQLFRGFGIKTEELVKSDMINLRYQEISEGDKSNERRPINVGFGITYILPVVVALLKAKPGDLIIVENPECHLHPRAQRKIGEMLAYIANAGVQIIVETHSDHVLNGLRLSVKRGIISKEYTQILFVEREDVGRHYHTNVYEPNLLDNGDLDVWPEGFFDEWDNSLIKLLE